MGNFFAKVVNNLLLIAFPVGMLLTIFDFWFGVKVMWGDVAIVLFIFMVKYIVREERDDR